MDSDSSGDQAPATGRSPELDSSVVDRSSERPRLPAPDRRQVLLIIAMLACYATGYPLALLADWSFGWILVVLGGVFLLALGVVTAIRVHESHD